jgi:hypothetical protein
MKIEYKKEFIPIKITLESKLELQSLLHYTKFRDRCSDFVDQDFITELRTRLCDIYNGLSEEK